MIFISIDEYQGRIFIFLLSLVFFLGEVVRFLESFVMLFIFYKFFIYYGNYVFIYRFTSYSFLQRRFFFEIYLNFFKGRIQVKFILYFLKYLKYKKNLIRYLLSEGLFQVVFIVVVEYFLDIYSLNGFFLIICFSVAGRRNV